MHHARLWVGATAAVVLALIVGAGVANANFKGDNGLNRVRLLDRSRARTSVSLTRAAPAPATLLTNAPELLRARAALVAGSTGRSSTMGHPQFLRPKTKAAAHRTSG